MLIVEQLSGRWKVKHPAIKPLAARAHELLAGFERWSIRHERRENNKQADAMANLALDDPRAAAAAERGGALVMGDIGPIGSANIGSAAAIFDDRGRVLLVKHTYGNFNWSLPGGLALPAEEPSLAAARELREETGARPRAGRDLGRLLRGRPRLRADAPFRLPVPRAGSHRCSRRRSARSPGRPATAAPISDFTENRIRDAHGGAYRS